MVMTEICLYEGRNNLENGSEVRSLMGNFINRKRLVIFSITSRFGWVKNYFRQVLKVSLLVGYRNVCKPIKLNQTIELLLL